jgi:large subunit ribosomal protein L25
MERNPALTRSTTMAEISVVAESRTQFGKGAARRLRREGKIPAVLYGHGSDPIHVALPGHQTTLALRQANVLFSIELDGKPQLAVAKDVQRDPVRSIIEHIDLLMVRQGEKIVVEVPVVVVGESAPGTTHFLEALSLEVEAEATHLPQSIEVSIDGLPADTVVHVSDIQVPAGVLILTPADHDVLSVTEIRATEEEEHVEAADEDTEGE